MIEPDSVTSKPLSARAMHSTIASAAALITLVTPFVQARPQAPLSIKLVDLNGDSQRDRLVNWPNGKVEVSLGVGQRQFVLVPQTLPQAEVVEFVVADLNGDELVDIYLVTGSSNFALVGDGAGLFEDVTSTIGLADEAQGLAVELEDIDSDGIEDLLLHNRDGDVLFWGRADGFDRDELTPFSSASNPFLSGESVIADSPFTVSQAPKSASPGAQGDSLKAGGGSTIYGSNLAGDQPGGNQPALASVAPGLLPPVSPGSTRGGYVLPFGLTAEEKEILGHMSIEQIPDGLGGTLKTIRFTGINVQIVNGSGATNGDPLNPGITKGFTNGLGNLIVGYNELGNIAGDDRTGSHNVILGNRNSYSEFAGIVAARENAITGAFASVTGGQRNTASGSYASVAGGESNLAKSNGSAVSGGIANIASGLQASVSGGRFNVAFGKNAAISGGGYNTANGFYSSVSGGALNRALGGAASISGGRLNTASGSGASVGGGSTNIASFNSSSVSGGYLNLASGLHSSISGGFRNTTSGFSASVSGGFLGISSGSYSSISGGVQNTASSLSSSVSGGLANIATGTGSSITGGNNNFTLAAYSTVGGGRANTASGSFSSVSGGKGSRALGSYSAVSGGENNTAIGSRSAVSGGASRTATGSFDWVGGGYSSGY